MLTEGQNFVLGIIAAFIEGILLQPTLYWKNAAAQKLPPQLIYTLNPRIIYRGTSMSIFNECQMMGFQFGITGFFQKFFTNRSLQSHSNTGSQGPYRLSIGEEFSSAIGGGAITAIFSSPIELIMIQQQLHGKSVFQTATGVVKQYGVLSGGLMRGLISTACRDSIYVSGMLVVTPVVQRYLQSPDSPIAYEGKGLTEAVASFYASLVGGVIAALPSHPFDVSKTCMQGDLTQNQYPSLSGTLLKLARDPDGGFRRLYQGCGMRTINITATVYIANECRNRFSPYMARLEL
jgi:hypothetical protein